MAYSTVPPSAAGAGSAVVEELQEAQKGGQAETPGAPDSGPGATFHGRLASHHGMMGAHYRAKAGAEGELGSHFGRIAEHHKALATEHAALAEKMPNTNPKDELIVRTKKAAVKRRLSPVSEGVSGGHPPID